MIAVLCHSNFNTVKVSLQKQNQFKTKIFQCKNAFFFIAVY